MYKKFIIFFTILLLHNNIFAAKIGAYGTDIMPYIDMTNQFADTFVDFKYGFFIDDGYATLKTNIPVKQKIMFENAKSVLELESDTLFDSLFNFEFKPTGTLEIVDFVDYGGTLAEVQSVDWNTEGTYLAVGGHYLSEPFPTHNELKIYYFDKRTEQLSLTDSKDYTRFINSVAWSPDGNYLAVAGEYVLSGNRLLVYSFNKSTGLLAGPLDTDFYAYYAYSLDWHPSGNYIAVGGKDTSSGNELQVFYFDGSNLTLADSKPYGPAIYSVNWSNDGNYLAAGRYRTSLDSEIQIYSFNSGTGLLSPSAIDYKTYGNRIYSVNWTYDDNYIAIGGQYPLSGNELQIYSFNGTNLSTYPIASKKYGTTIYSVNWTKARDYLAVGGYQPLSGNELQIYSFTESGTLVENPKYSIDYGDKVFSVDFSDDEHYLSVGGYHPRFETELEIYDFSDTSSILQGYISGNENSIILNGNLTIPTGKKLEFLSDTLIDAQNKTLTLEDEAQLIIDSKVTLTLRNIILQTGENSDKKPIKLYMDGNLCLQNASIILDDDFLFENGNLFIKEDIKFSGPHEFIYSSTHKCYINKNSKLKVLQDSTFTYSPKSIDRNLIIMQDKSSKLMLKNCTLASTYTGLRLTKGNLIFDGLVTLTHLNINTEIVSETTTQTSNITVEDLIHTITYQNLGLCVDFSPDGKLLAIGGSYHDGTGTGQIFRVDSYDQITKVSSIPFSMNMYTVAFSPNGKFIAFSGDGSTGYVYLVDSEGNLTYADDIAYGFGASKVNDLKWSLDSKFIVGSAHTGTPGRGAQIFSVDDNGIVTAITTFPFPYNNGETACFSPNGNFLAAGGRDTSGYSGAQTFQFNVNGTIKKLVPLGYESSATSIIYSMQYSPDQKYLAVGGWRNGAYDNIRIYEINKKGAGSHYWTLPQTDITDARSVSWSEDSKTLVVASGLLNATLPNYSKIYTLDLPNKQIINTKTIGFGDGTGTTVKAAVSPDLRIYAFAGKWDTPSTSTTNAATYIFSPVYDELVTTSVYYGNSNLHPRGLDNYITFGNTSIGKSENLYIDILSGAKVNVYGTLNIENVE